jgi:RNA polymerase sigma factor (sigma-70 family)
MREATVPARQSVRPHAIVLSLVSDERLARLAAAGDSLAFTTIYQRYHAPLYRYCRSIVGSPDDASDVLQNTMLAAFRSLQGEIRSIRLKPWLYKIAHNESVSLLRTRRPTVDLEAAGQVAGSDMAVDAATRERLRALMADVSTLSEQQRGALLMRELNGLEYQEIGAALGTSEGAAKQSVHEARIALTDAEAGRDMECASIRAIVSERDGRQLRARRVRAHLDDCISCSTFRASIVTRRRDLAAFVPVVPVGAATAALKGAFGGVAAAETGGIAAMLTGGAATGTGAAAKGAAIAAVAATMGVGTYAYVEKQEERAKDKEAASRVAQDRGDVSPPRKNVVIRPERKDVKDRAGAGQASGSDKHKYREPKPPKVDKAFVAQVPEDDERDVVVHEPKPEKEPKQKAPDEETREAGSGGKDEDESGSGGGGKQQEPQQDEPEDELPDNLDDLLAGDLADLLDNYSNAFLAGNFGSDEINEILARYTGIVKDYTGANLADKISGTLDGTGITSMLEQLTGKSSVTGAESENLVSRLLPNLGSLLP